MKRTRLPNAYSSGFCKIYADRGDLVVYKEDNVMRLARVLDTVSKDGMGAEYPSRRLLVLTLSYDGRHAYVRHVDPVDVVSCHEPHDNSAFVAWFFAGTLPKTSSLEETCRAGAMNQAYFGEYTDSEGRYLSPVSGKVSK